MVLSSEQKEQIESDISHDTVNIDKMYSGITGATEMRAFAKTVKARKIEDIKKQIGELNKDIENKETDILEDKSLGRDIFELKKLYNDLSRTQKTQKPIIIKLDGKVDKPRTTRKSAPARRPKQTIINVSAIATVAAPKKKKKKVVKKKKKAPKKKKVVKSKKK